MVIGHPYSVLTWVPEPGQSWALSVSVELDIHPPSLGQERAQSGQHPTSDAILAAKGRTLSLRVLAVEPMCSLLAQIELQVDGGHVVAHTHGASHIAEGVLVAGFALAALAVVEEPISGFQVSRP